MHVEKKPSSLLMVFNPLKAIFRVDIIIFDGLLQAQL